MAPVIRQNQSVALAADGKRGILVNSCIIMAFLYIQLETNDAASYRYNAKYVRQANDSKKKIPQTVIKFFQILTTIIILILLFLKSDVVSKEIALRQN